MKPPIGSIDQKQLETLMVDGVTPEQAVGIVVAGCFVESFWCAVRAEKALAA